MTMNWDSLDAFLRMGGYGRFVWGAYGVTLGLMMVEALFVRRRLRRAVHDVRSGAAGDRA